MDCNPFKIIRRGEDGVYRWGYELNMATNPVILLMFVKFIVILAYFCLLCLRFWIGAATTLATAWLKTCETLVFLPCL